MEMRLHLIGALGIRLIHLAMRVRLQRNCAWTIAVAILCTTAPTHAQQPPEQGGPNTGRLYAQNCASCHDARAVEKGAPDRSVISQLAPEAIYRSLTTGSMAESAKHLSNPQKRQIAEFVAGRQLPGDRASDISAMKNRCPSAPLGDPFQ